MSRGTPPADRPRYRRAVDPASYTRNSMTAQGGAASMVAVWVMRMSFARTGANEITVLRPVPFPSATGALHVAPSIDTWTWKPRGYPPVVWNPPDCGDEDGVKVAG